MEKSEYIIQIEHLTKSFETDKKWVIDGIVHPAVNVLDDVNINIRKGEFITILGPSGCGKTTLLRLLAGFLTPTSGRILLEGKDITAMPPYQRPMNTVFQRYALFPHLDVYDNIAFGLKLNKTPEKEIDKKVRKVLKLVSMTDYEDRDVNSLSGGQQQRVAIARAIVNQPKVLLLDEPLAALDLKMRKDMQIELKEMHQKLGITFIYVTHDQEEALTLSDTIIVVNEGKIQQIGRPKDIYDEPCNSFVADFIGESNILNGTMLEDRKVRFIDHDFECVDEGFGTDTLVDVVVRPEDIYITKKLEVAQFTGKVKSCIFKGVHYEMFVETDSGHELMIQDYNAFDIDSTIGMLIKPADIQVMKKERICNTFEATVINEDTIEFAGGEFKVDPQSLKAEAGETVKVNIAFDKVDLLDNKEDGVLRGQVKFILYKGNHYHLEVITKDDYKIYVDTNDIWDKGDFVGINIAPSDITVVRDE